MSVTAPLAATALGLKPHSADGADIPGSDLKRLLPLPPGMGRALLSNPPSGQALRGSFLALYKPRRTLCG